MTPSPPRRRIALTGGIASGKSSVADILTGLGAVVIDSDHLAREVVQPGTPGLTSIVQRFGDHVLASDGSLDRAALGRLVFGDEQARADLNALVHPLVQRRRREIIAALPEDTVVVQMIPLLVEIGMADQFDEVIVVDVDEATQLERLIRRDDLSPREARARLQAQADRASRLRAATRVIDNSGEPKDLPQQVRQVWDELLGSLATTDEER